VHFCQGQTSAGNDQRVKSFDGVPLDTDVALPASGDANLPLVVLLHGWGGSKVGFNQMKAWADRGYAVLSYTARGFNGSCGRPDNRLFDPSGCATGWLHLADVRWEVRDTQFLAGKLADQGLIDGQRIGVTGPSYGGGQAMDLAVLKDRYMDQDANLHPWVSDGGHPMRIAAAAPTIPWTDLAYSLEPNGRTLDYTIASPKDDVTPLGVDKQSFVSGLYALGQATGFYSPPGVDPSADLTTQFARLNAGEPTDPAAQAIATEITTYHSSYYLDHSEAPAPLLIANGFTDDLFPVDEALRFYNRSHAQYPYDPIALMFFDFGHMRGTGRAADTARLQQRQFDWFDHYVKGDASVPTLTGVETLTQTCPKDAPSDGPSMLPTGARCIPARSGSSLRTRNGCARRAATRTSAAPWTRSQAAATRAPRHRPRTCPGRPRTGCRRSGERASRSSTSGSRPTSGRAPCPRSGRPRCRSSRSAQPRPQRRPSRSRGRAGRRRRDRGAGRRRGARRSGGGRGSTRCARRRAREPIPPPAAPGSARRDPRGAGR
jgi:hypothetical protein